MCVKSSNLPNTLGTNPYSPTETRQFLEGLSVGKAFTGRTRGNVRFLGTSAMAVVVTGTNAVVLDEVLVDLRLVIVVVRPLVEVDFVVFVVFEVVVLVVFVVFVVFVVVVLVVFVVFVVLVVIRVDEKTLKSLILTSSKGSKSGHMDCGSRMRSCLRLSQHQLPGACKSPHAHM